RSRAVAERRRKFHRLQAAAQAAAVRAVRRRQIAERQRRIAEAREHTRQAVQAREQARRAALAEQEAADRDTAPGVHGLRGQSYQARAG
ncbi:MAG: hypothetical protein ACRDT8_12460, partial [Micromonosporaceae bacterium]